MDETGITEYVVRSFDGVETMTNLGYLFFFYGADRMLPFITIAAPYNEYEQISNLTRPGVFRLNIGVRKQTFQSLFGTGAIDLSAYDFTALDTVMPHPHYAAQSWICVLNPSDATFQTLQPLLHEAHGLAARRAAKRSRS